MLEYDRIDVSEGIGTNKTNGLRGCIICHSWYLFGINLRFKPKECDGCQDITEKYLSFNDVVIVTVGRIDYWIHLGGMSKKEAVNRMKTW